MRISVEYSLSLFISLDTVFLNIVVVGFENNFKLTKKLQKQEIIQRIPVYSLLRFICG